MIKHEYHMPTRSTINSEALHKSLHESLTSKNIDYKKNME